MEMTVTTDRYTKIVLTFIAACLAVLTLKALNVEPIVRAATSLSCKGKLEANVWGGVTAGVGGYDIKVDCD